MKFECPYIKCKDPNKVSKSFVSYLEEKFYHGACLVDGFPMDARAKALVISIESYELGYEHRKSILDTPGPKG